MSDNWMDDAFAEVARENAADHDRRSTPEKIEQRRARTERERQRRIAMGWEDEDGNSLLPPEEDEDKDEGE